MIPANRLRQILSILTGPTRLELNQRIRCHSRLRDMEDRSKTAGIVIIGDEILKGQTLDTNTQKICQRFYQLGFKVKRTVIIPDEVDVIAKQVAEFSSAYDYVVTSGGVGPTHDDMTYDGVAKAFDVKLARHPVLVQLLEKHFGNDHSHPAFKMSEVPETATVLWNKERRDSFPLVTVKNVYILPGIPSFMERCLQCLYDILQPYAVPAPNTSSVFVASDEVSITKTLNAAVEKFHESVSFGSYPNVCNNYYRVQLTLESDDREKVEEARQYLLDNLPQDSVVDYVADPVTDAASRLYDFLEDPAADEEFRQRLGCAVHKLEEALNKYKPEEMCISFNGGKDCTALLHLYHCVMKRKFPEWKEPLAAMYIKCSIPFPEIDIFLKETTERYNLNLQTVNGPIKPGLAKFLASNPEIKTILMGNRRTDPHSENLQHFQMTDAEWPQVMRVFPLLNLSYVDIWKFIRRFSIPYCLLYDKGFTSLGSMHNTSLNPNLRYVNERGQISYHPAYMLKESDKERSGRL